MATAKLVNDKDRGVWQLIHDGKVITEQKDKYYLRRKVTQGAYREEHGVTDCVDADYAPHKRGQSGPAELVPTDVSIVGEKFNINERFDFVAECAEGVAKGDIRSLILCGRGGLGKTHTVMKAVTEAGLENVRDIIGSQELDADEQRQLLESYKGNSYVVIKGYSSPRGLYNALYENRNRLIIFDDCDSILRDEVAENILKAALDSYEERWVSWNAEAAFGDDVPRFFEFKGSIIFISNMSLNRIDEAVRTRGVCIDLSMTLNQMIERMNHIAASPNFMPNTDVTVKVECMKLIDDWKENIPNLSMRTLITMVNLRNSNSVKDWKRTAEYVIGCQ